VSTSFDETTIDFTGYGLGCNLVYLLSKVTSNVAKYFFQLIYYREFHRFGQAKFPGGGLVLGLSQFSILPQLPQKKQCSV